MEGTKTSSLKSRTLLVCAGNTGITIVDGGNASQLYHQGDAGIQSTVTAVECASNTTEDTNYLCAAGGVDGVINLFAFSGGKSLKDWKKNQVSLGRRQPSPIHDIVSCQRLLLSTHNGPDIRLFKLPDDISFDDVPGIDIGRANSLLSHSHGNVKGLSFVSPHRFCGYSDTTLTRWNIEKQCTEHSYQVSDQTITSISHSRILSLHTITTSGFNAGSIRFFDQRTNSKNPILSYSEKSEKFFSRFSTSSPALHSSLLIEKLWLVLAGGSSSVLALDMRCIGSQKDEFRPQPKPLWKLDYFAEKKQSVVGRFSRMHRKMPIVRQKSPAVSKIVGFGENGNYVAFCCGRSTWFWNLEKLLKSTKQAEKKKKKKKKEDVKSTNRKVNRNRNSNRKTNRKVNRNRNSNRKTNRKVMLRSEIGVLNDTEKMNCAEIVEYGAGKVFQLALTKDVDVFRTEESDEWYRLWRVEMRDLESRIEMVKERVGEKSDLELRIGGEECRGMKWMMVL